MSNISLFLIIAVPRLAYIALTEQTAGDTTLYFRISKNILNGCGFSASENSIDCEPITGGYFPAYPYLIAVFQYFEFSEKEIALFIGVCFALSVLYLRRALECATNNPKLALAGALAVGLSPLSFGWSRLLLIEPIMTLFSILLLSQLLMIWKKRKMFLVFRATALIAIATHFKPTAVVFVLPFCLSVIYTFGYQRGIRILFVSGLSLILAILPWEYRNWSLGAHSSVTIKSNIWPPDYEYSAWVHSWSITEYERARARFPINRGDLDSIVIKPNLFLSHDEAQRANVLITRFALTESAWNDFIDDEFSRFVIERQSSQGYLALAGLRILQMSSLLLHPGNSWGFPISLTLPKAGDDARRLFGYDLNLNNVMKIVSKGFLFLYRVLLFSLFLFLVFWVFSNRVFGAGGSRSLYFEAHTHKLDRGPFNFLAVLALSLLIATLFLFVFIVSGLEHRYLGPVIPWVEIVATYYILDRRKNQ
jgi:hypothetical protein